MNTSQNSTKRDCLLEKLQHCLQTKHRANVLMPGRNARHPDGQAFKGPMHAHKDGRWTWERAKREDWQNAEMVGLLLKDLIVPDLDGLDFLTEYEKAFPCLQLCPKEETRKGAHYFFERTPLCDELGIFDCARALKSDILPSEADNVLPLDIKTVCSTGTCGFLVVTPSRDKSWVPGREPWTIPITPIPDDFVRAIADMRIKRPLSESREIIDNSESVASNVFLDDIDDNTEHKNSQSQNIRFAPAWEQFEKLVLGLNIQRHVKPHSYPLWSQLGWAISNVGRTGKYLNKARDLFDTISRRSSAYSEDSVLDVLDHARTDGARLGFRYILDMLKEDNPLLYKEYTMTVKPLTTTNNPLEKAIYDCLEFVTNSSIASVFVTKHGKDFVWLSGGKHFYWFDGTHWRLQKDYHVAWNLLTSSLSESFHKARLEIQSTLDVADKTKESLMTKYRDNAILVLAHLGDTVKKRQVLTEIAMRLSDPAIVDKMDKNRDLLCFTDKVVDLRTKEIRPGRHDDYLTISTGYPYPTSDMSYVPDILEYFKRVLPEEAEREYFLDQQAQRLSGHLHGQTVHLYTGSGGNGKSLTFQSLLKLVWGKYYQTLPVTVITSRRSAPGQATPELARICNCRRLVCVEPEDDAKINVSLIKQLSGGDEQEVRALYGDMVNFEPQFKVDILCNKMIAIDGSDGGAKRRIRAQHWPSKFSSEFREPNYETNEYPAERTEIMTTKFGEWRDDLMLFFINRYRADYIENAPLNIRKFTEEYMDENNIYAHFCGQFVEASSDKGAYFTLKNAKSKWSDFMSVMLREGTLPKKEPAPKERDFREGLVAILKTPCHKDHRVPGRIAHSVFLGFILHDQCLTDRENDAELWVPDS